MVTEVYDSVETIDCRVGGGGFSMEPYDLLLDQYILAQSPCQQPKICFLPTASGDSDHYITRFYTAFTQLVSHRYTILKSASDRYCDGMDGLKAT